MAQELANLCGGKALSFKGLPDVLSRADILISATKSPHFIIKKSDIKELISKRNKKLYIYDVAFPRDIDPTIAEWGSVVLKNMDDLAKIFEKYNEKINCIMLFSLLVFS